MVDPQDFRRRDFIRFLPRRTCTLYLYISFAAYERNFIPREQDQALTLTRHLDNR